jgi:hypothetical protein
MIYIASSMSYMIPEVGEDKKISEFERIKALIFEKASSIGLRSGE